MDKRTPQMDKSINLYATTGKLPGNIKRKFISNIVAFEKKLQESSEITVFEFLGKPEFKKAEDMYPDELILELCRFNKLFEKHCISLEMLHVYPDDVIYRFITDELFQKKIQDIRLPGYWQHFIYEEFHPNHPSDIKRQGEEFIRVLFGNDWRFINSVLSETIVCNGKNYHRNKLDEFYNIFLDRFGSSKIISAEAKLESFDEKTAQVVMNIKVDQSRFPLKDNLLSILINLENKFEWWQVNSIQSPAFQTGL